MNESNIVRMPKSGEPLETEAMHRVEEFCSLLLACAGKSLDRLREAEESALRRLEEYVPTEPLLNTRQAAAYLGFTARWLDEATRPGKEPVVPFMMIGGCKRFRKSALDQALTQKEVKPKKVTL